MKNNQSPNTSGEKILFFFYESSQKGTNKKANSQALPVISILHKIYLLAYLPV